MTTVKKHLLTDFVRKNLVAVSGGDATGDRVCSEASLFALKHLHCSWSFARK